MTGDAVDVALAPVRAALIASAEADAAALLATADGAGGAVAEARERAAELVARARAEGAANAAAVLAADRARAHRDGRRIVLAAQREAYEQLRRQARAAVTALRADPGYDRLRARLVGRVEAVLGPGATIVEHPGGGVVGSVPGRRCDLSLPAIADRAVDALGPEVERLWTR
ncbi:MAG TPA: hypothetical protein VI357_27040 [Mycobacteriales bacterium]